MAYVEIEKDKLERAWKYANLLPTATLRRYASNYIAWLQNGCEGLEPFATRGPHRVAARIRSDVEAMNLWTK